ncbi:MAG: hypothetical protein M0T85_14270 [Dehalococcoidales bacterium]|nr:hypothetical protein [Dehalococcoidales bacterium]
MALGYFFRAIEVDAHVIVFMAGFFVGIIITILFALFGPAPED